MLDFFRRDDSFEIERERRFMEKQCSKPFHEVIRELINTCSEEEIFIICSLLTTTHLPKGHDDILEALKRRFRDPKFENYSFLKVTKKIIAEKKQDAEEKARSPYGGDKSRILMELIHRIILRYENNGPTKRDNEIFKLFELAKKVRDAKDDEQLTLAIAEIDKT